MKTCHTSLNDIALFFRQLMLKINNIANYNFTERSQHNEGKVLKTRITYDLRIHFIYS